MKPETLRAPKPGFSWSASYAIRPREKRSFQTVLDAEALVDPSRHSEVKVTGTDAGVAMSLTHPAARGVIRESATFGLKDSRLVTSSLAREVLDQGGALVRREAAEPFHHPTLALPDATYPEVMLPFLLAFAPEPHSRRCLFAWINDRFVARVYVDTAGKETLNLPIGKRTAIHAVMYPDLNDWVALGTILTKLAKPFLPKYAMWFDEAPPHGVVRFEGPYGPPGAPEIVLELAKLG